MVWQLPPEICQWDITDRCNLACRHCRATTSWQRNGELLPFSTVISILEQLISFAPNVCLALAGGEPLSRKDLKEILTWLERKTDLVKVELLTNGTLITSENIDWLAELVDGFNISLEGAREEVNDLIRGKGSFSKALRGISFLVERGLPVTVRMTFFHQEEKEVEELMRFLPKIGVRSFNFRYVIPIGRASGSRISAIQYERQCQRVWQLGQELGMQVGFSDPFPEILVNKALRDEFKNDKGLQTGGAVTGCSMGFSLLYLDPHGIVKTCPYFPLECGDAKSKSLEEIWFHSETLDRIRRIRGVLKGKCGQCQYKFACGGCRGAAWAMGNFLGEDPRCWKQES